MRLPGEVALAAMALKQEQLEAEAQMRKVQQRNQMLQGYQGYLNTCNAMIALVNDIIATDAPSDDRKATLLRRQEQAQQDAAFARESIFAMLDDMLDHRPPPYAPNILVV